MIVRLSGKPDLGWQPDLGVKIYSVDEGCKVTFVVVMAIDGGDGASDGHSSVLVSSCTRVPLSIYAAHSAHKIPAFSLSRY